MERKLETLLDDLQHMFPGDLIAVFLYGSAAAGEHVSGRSDINVGVVLRNVEAATLRKASARIGAWHRLGFSTPLFIDPDFLQGAVDVFPIEFQDMRDRHRVLFGPDVLAGLQISEHDLRRQCEQELRGKLLKLRQTYIESAQDPETLGAVLIPAVSSIAVLARMLLRLHGHDPSGRTDAVFARVHERLGVQTGALLTAWQLKTRAVRRTGSELERLFADVIEATAHLAQVADASRK